MIANGAESEPASDKDATLLWLAPHLVLDGLQLVAEALGADTAILVTHADREHDVAGRVRQALQERLSARLDRVPVQLAVAPARFLSGQETALVNHLGGGPSIPTFMPPADHRARPDGNPTLVQNVETLAQLALIARRGPRWFREVGTARRAGLDAGHHPPGRRPDSDHRDPARPPAAEICSATRRSPESAVLLGGYHGMWLPGGPGGRADPRQRSRSSRPARGSGPASSSACRPTGAASWRPPASSATWPWSRPASAARASTACPASRPRSSSWPTGRPRPTTVEDLRALVRPGHRPRRLPPPRRHRPLRPLAPCVTFAAEVDRHAARPLLGDQHRAVPPHPGRRRPPEDDWM